MRKLCIVQWGKKRSIVKEVFTDNMEVTYLIVDNQYLMNLDEMGYVL